MRIIVAIGFCLATLLASPVYSQTAGQAAPGAAKPEKPKVYALISAVGEQFTIMFQKQSVGSHFPPYERSSIKVEHNILNRYVLHSLDKAIAASDPGSKRVFMTLRAFDMDAVSPSEREAVALREIVDDLKGMTERQDWDRIVVATPAYKAFELNGVAGRLEGLGVFYQPLNGGMFMGNNLDDYGGEDAVTPEDKLVRSKRYAAPFSFIEIWVLDPKTLTVIEKQQRFDNIKVYDPLSDSIGISQNVSPQVLLEKVGNLVERSVGAAIAHSEFSSKRGIIDVGDVREVKPDDAKK